MTSPGSVEGRDRLRLFCALRLPREVVAAIADWQRETFGGLRGVRSLRPEQLHVTLAFLGSRPAADVERVRDVLRARAAATPVPRFGVAGYRETRSVGMLVLSEDAGAAGLAYGLQRDLVGEVERRPWLPHVTVLRFRERPRLAPSLPELGDFSPSDAAVYHSVLRSTGAQYEVLDSFALGGR